MKNLAFIEEAISDLKKAFANLNNLIDSTEASEYFNEHYTDTYPFEMSFDDLTFQVLEWEPNQKVETSTEGENTEQTMESALAFFGTPKEQLFDLQSGKLNENGEKAYSRCVSFLSHLNDFLPQALKIKDSEICDFLDQVLEEN